ncbi:PREDICTED: uncharacterized protein LOC105617137 [Atta cephalotes]|uniref:Uncharacterized protein n=1 Tax=Atta cephalotes TaxID=12957 RepID=A0A158N992_ATTCE|nr:PREDICTED: uncharacterized protein LOC105617137 [Atta cephalotes]
MPSLRVKYVLAHLSRTEHTALLARPNWRRLRRRDPNVLASPFTVRRRAILKSRASRRTRVMAQPKFVTKKYDPAAAPPLFPRIHPKTLAAKSTKRIVDLALPKRRRLLETRKLAATKNMKATVNDLLVKVRKSRYQRYRVFCNARQEREARKKRKRMAKLRRALTKPEDWQRHMRVLERLAAPKVVAKPKKRKPSKKRKWRPVNLERVYFLALPLIRKDIVLKDPFKVAEHALTYIISKRMERLSIRKIRPEIPLRIPGAVSPAAMKAIGSNTHFATTFTTTCITDAPEMVANARGRRGSVDDFSNSSDSSSISSDMNNDYTFEDMNNDITLEDINSLDSSSIMSEDMNNDYILEGINSLDSSSITSEDMNNDYILEDMNNDITLEDINSLDSSSITSEDMNNDYILEDEPEEKHVSSILWFAAK